MSLPVDWGQVGLTDFMKFVQQTVANAREDGAWINDWLGNKQHNLFRNGDIPDAQIVWDDFVVMINKHITYQQNLEKLIVPLTQFAHLLQIRDEQKARIGFLEAELTKIIGQRDFCFEQTKRFQSEGQNLLLENETLKRQLEATVIQGKAEESRELQNLRGLNQDLQSESSLVKQQLQECSFRFEELKKENQDQLTKFTQFIEQQGDTQDELNELKEELKKEVQQRQETLEFAKTQFNENQTLRQQINQLQAEMARLQEQISVQPSSFPSQIPSSSVFKDLSTQELNDFFQVSFISNLVDLATRRPQTSQLRKDFALDDFETLRRTLKQKLRNSNPQIPFWEWYPWLQRELISHLLRPSRPQEL